jgi:hypothetical protein
VYTSAIPQNYIAGRLSAILVEHGSRSTADLGRPLDAASAVRNDFTAKETT